MIHRTKADAGFTLIETLVTGLTAVVVLAAAATFMNFFIRASSMGTTSDLIQMQSQGIIDQISPDVQTATQVLGPTETYSTTPSTNAATVTEIRMYNTNGLVFAAYKIKNLVLWEVHPNPAVATLDTTTYYKFTIANKQPVYLTATSNFTLAALRKSVTIGLAITAATSQGVQDTTTMRNELVDCRN